MKPYFPIIVAILFGLALSAHVIYADEFIMPFGAGNFVDSWVEIIFNPVETGGVDVRVVQTSLFHYDNIIEMPDQFVVTHQKSSGGVEKQIVVVKQIWENMIVPLPEPEIEQVITVIPPEIQAKLDAKRTELEEKFKEALFCTYGIGGSSVFQAEREVIILKQMEYFKHLPTSYQHTRLILATEECEVFRGSYLYKYPQYEDIAADIAKYHKEPFVLDETDSPHTDPVTQRDLDKAAQQAADLPKPYRDPYGGCIPHDEDDKRCEQRGGYTAGAQCQLRPVEPGITSDVMCPLQELQSYLTTTVTVEQNWTIVKQLVCDTYLPQYESIVNRILEGDENTELPEWLNHCELTTDE